MVAVNNIVPSVGTLMMNSKAKAPFTPDAVGPRWEVISMQPDREKDTYRRDGRAARPGITDCGGVSQWAF